jgi:Gpi18-like mannosyltransferase
MSNTRNKKHNKAVEVKSNPIKKRDLSKSLPLETMGLVLIAVVIIRILISQIMSHKIDMNMYVMWSNTLAEKGFTGFYNSSHIVYGPIYMYMLMISGKIASFFSITGLGQEYLVKFWPVLSDFIGAYFIFLIGKKHQKPNLGFWTGVFYVLNPAIFMNSSIMGQFDSIPATMLIAVVYFFSIKKHVPAVILYTVAALTKPQSIYLLPLVGYLFLFQDVEWRKVLPVFTKTFSIQSVKAYFLNKFYLLKFMLGSIGVVFTYVITVLPFYISVPYPVNPNVPAEQLRPLSDSILTRTVDLFMWFKRLTIDCSIGDYPYATADGFNFFTLIKGQVRNDGDLINGLFSYATLAKLFMLVLGIFAIWILIKMKGSTFSMFLSAYVLGFGFFMFYTRMHERYLVPAMIFTVVCVIWEIRLFIPAILLSVGCFLNQYLLYDMAIKENNYWFSPDYMPGTIIAVMFLLVFVYISSYIIIKGYKDTGRSNNVSTF